MQTMRSLDHIYTSLHNMHIIKSGCNYHHQTLHQMSRNHQLHVLDEFGEIKIKIKVDIDQYLFIKLPSRNKEKYHVFWGWWLLCKWSYFIYKHVLIEPMCCFVIVTDFSSIFNSLHLHFRTFCVYGVWEFKQVFTMIFIWKWQRTPEHGRWNKFEWGMVINTFMGISCECITVIGKLYIAYNRIIKYFMKCMFLWWI